jgi:glycosyltransferase involved in cell wall biosynthesis
MEPRPRRLLFMFTEDWAFASLFLDRAIAAKSAGCEVAVLVRCSEHRTVIEQAGLQVIPHNISRSGLNPFRELVSVFQLIKVFRSFRPDVIHLIALKPIVLGSLASIFYPKAKVVNAPVGMGYLFASNDVRARLARPLVKLVLKSTLGRKRSMTIIENSDDRRSLVEGGFLHSNQIVLIRGTGVNLEVFRPTTEPDGPKIVVLIARMLRDKGVFEFVESARIIKRTNSTTSFWLIGDADPGNPASLTTQQLQEWNDEGIVKWLGYRTDVADLLTQVHIVCLPSYREGFGKVFVEAGAALRAVVATDVPGCREAVEHQVNGLLVEPKNSEALAAALIEVLENDQLRLRLAKEGRRRAEFEFSSETVNAQTLAVYQQVLNQ